MTRRISRYVVFITLIWSAHTQNEKKVPDMFKSNMTRNDFSKLLQSLIKLNEQRVSVLQKLYKLQDYGVLSEVLRSGDNQPAENGNPNNLFLIVMSKNESDPTRRKVGYEVVDTVKSLDVGNIKVYPKLNYVLDPAGYVSRKENSIESLFKFVPMFHDPKKTHLIKDGSKANTNTKKSNSGLITEVKDFTSKENKYSKFDTVCNKGSTNPSEELRNSDNKRNNYPPFGYHASPRHTEIFVTKMDIIEDKKSNNIPNHKYSMADKENDYDSPFSKEHVNKVPNRQYAKIDSDITIKMVNPKPKINVYSSKINLQGNHLPKFYSNKYILNNQGKKSTIIKKDIKSTTNKKNLRIINPVNSHKTDFSNNNQNYKFSLEDKDVDENEYGSSIGNSPNRQYTKMYSDVSVEKVHDSNSLKPKKYTQSPKINVHSNQHHRSKLNKNKSILNNENNRYSKIKAEIITTAKKINMRMPVKNDNQNDKFQEKDENEYGSPIGKEYVSNDPNRKYTKMDTDISYEKLYDANNRKPKINTDSPKINIHSNQLPKINKNKSVLNNHHGNKYSIIKADIKKPTNKNKIRMPVMRPHIKSEKADTLPNNNQNDKFPLEEKVEDLNKYGSPIGKKNVGNGPNHQYIKLDTDISSEMHDTSNTKTKINTDSPNINVHSNQHPPSKLNKNKSILNNDGNKYSVIKADIKSTTIKNVFRIISPVTSDKTETLSNNNQSNKFPFGDIDEEDENIYGSPFSKEYDDRDPNRQTTKKDSDSPKVNLLVNQNLMSIQNMYSTIKTVIRTTTAKNDYMNSNKASKNIHGIENPTHSFNNIVHTNKYSSLTIAKTSGFEIPKTTKDMPYKNDDNYDYPKDIGNYNKFSPLTTAKASDSEIPKTTKDLPYKNEDIGNYNKFSSLTTAKASSSEIPTKDSPYKNDSNYDYPKDIGNYANNYNQGITRDPRYGVKRGNANTAKDIYRGNKDSSPPTMETFNVKAISKDSTSQMKYVAHNSKKLKPKTAKDLDHGINVDYDGKENFKNDEEFVIGQNNDGEFSVIVTHVRKDKQEEIKPPKNLRINSKEFDKSENRHAARNGLVKCVNKKAKKLCYKSCISAYKNVCTRMKCTSRAKKALKKECKKSCKKTFAKSSSKYSDESTSDESGSDDSDSDSS